MHGEASNTSEADPNTLNESLCTLAASVINPNLEPLVNITFEELKAESFSMKNWFRLTLENTIRYLYWPEDQLLCKKYVGIGENLDAKVSTFTTCDLQAC